MSALLFTTGVPGGPELLIILLIMLLLFVLPLAVLGYLAYRVLSRRDAGTDQSRVEELEAEVERLQSRVEELEE